MTPRLLTLPLLLLSIGAGAAAATDTGTPDPEPTATPAPKTSDNCMWATVALLHHPFTPKLSVLYTLEYRMKDNISTTDLYSGNLNIDYSVSPRVKLGVGYEIYYENDGDRYRVEHCYYPQLLWTQPIGPVKAVLRARVYNMFYHFDEPYLVSRNRLKFSCPIPKTPLTPFAYVETYNRLQSGFFSFDKVRYTAGVNIAFGHCDLDLGFQIDKYYTKDYLKRIAKADFTVEF